MYCCVYIKVNSSIDSILRDGRSSQQKRFSLRLCHKSTSSMENPWDESTHTYKLSIICYGFLLWMNIILILWDIEMKRSSHSLCITFSLPFLLLSLCLLSYSETKAYLVILLLIRSMFYMAFAFPLLDTFMCIYSSLLCALKEHLPFHCIYPNRTCNKIPFLFNFLSSPFLESFANK